MPLSRRYCRFWLGSQSFGIPVEQVHEVIRYQEVTRVPLAPHAVAGLINLRGQIVPAIDLRRRLGLPGCASAPPLNLITGTKAGTVSLLVDNIGDVIDVEESMCETPPPTLDEFAREVVRGVYKLTEGLLLALDAERLVNLKDAHTKKPLGSSSTAVVEIGQEQPNEEGTKQEKQ